VQAEAVGALLPSRPVEASRSADLIAATARQAMTELRRLLGVLRFNASDGFDGFDALTPPPSIAHLDGVVAFVREAGLPVACHVSGAPAVLSPVVDLTAYRIVQEALTNVLRHAPGSMACVDVDYAGDYVTVRVTDSGAALVPAPDVVPGVVPASAAHARLAHGYGLAGIAERVASCGGTLTLGPLPPGGFAVTARLPLT
jgi:signal transduction histidine kinase